MKKLAIIISFFVLTTFSYAQSVERDLKNFTGINISSAFSVELVEGPTSKVVIDIVPEKYIENVITEVKNGVLVVSIKGKVNNTKKMHLTISYQALNSIVVSGACSVKADQVINSDNFTIKTTGASSLDLKLNSEEVLLTSTGASEIKLIGSTTTFKTKLTGASSVKAKTFKAKKVSVEASGASSLGIYASQGISGVISGASSVYLLGDPAAQKINKSGAASITKGN